MIHLNKRPRMLPHRFHSVYTPIKCLFFLPSTRQTGARVLYTYSVHILNDFYVWHTLETCSFFLRARGASKRKLTWITRACWSLFISAAHVRCVMSAHMGLGPPHIVLLYSDDAGLRADNLIAAKSRPTKGARSSNITTNNEPSGDVTHSGGVADEEDAMSHQSKRGKSGLHFFLFSSYAAVCCCVLVGNSLSFFFIFVSYMAWCEHMQMLWM